MTDEEATDQEGSKIDYEELPGVSDQEEKHITVLDKSGERKKYEGYYLCHGDDEFYVSEEETFPESNRTRYRKKDIKQLRVDQHHPASCFITTATMGAGPELDTLKGFRDDALEPTAPGRALVRFYYAVSPSIATTLRLYPNSGTTRMVRRIVRIAASMAERRDVSTVEPARTGLTVLVTLIYVIGMFVALAGHGYLRLREVLDGVFSHSNRSA